MTQREAFLWYLEQFVGTFYSWGGDDPSQGFDCSGLVVEGLQAVGILPRGTDWSADALCKKFPPRATPEPGDLVFWCDDQGRAFHVETVWRNPDLTIGASGGTSKTLTKEDAIRDNAFVKVRPWASRAGNRVFRNPFV